MDQSLVHTFSWGNSYGPMVLKVLQKFPPYTGIGPWMAPPREASKGNKADDVDSESPIRIAKVLPTYQ